MNKNILEWFTIGRIIIGIAGAAAVSLGVADYVSRAYLGGLTTAVENLQASLNNLSETVRQADEITRLRAEIDEVKKEGIKIDRTLY